MARRYFEQAGGVRFWEVWREGATVYTRYGKRGAAGQIKVKTLASDTEAKRHVELWIADKHRDQYRPAKLRAAAASAQPRAKPGTPVKVVVPKGAFRLELVSGRSAKFWQIHREDKKLTITFGRIGTPGEIQVRKFREAYECERARDTLIAEKQKRGYALVFEVKTNTIVAQNPGLDAQIASAPDDDDGFMVYADWLQTAGDVRGELAVLQSRIAKKPRDKALADAEKKLLWDHRGHFWGPLTPYIPRKLPKKDEPRAIVARWRQGWIDRLVLSAVGGWRVEDHGLPPVRNAAELVRLLPAVVSARHLRELVIGCPVAEDSFEFHESIAALVKVMPALRALRRLTLGEFTYEDSELSWSKLGKLDALWPVAGKLEYLKIKAGEMALGPIVAPELRELWIETGGLSKKSLAAILAADVPRLERLNLWFGQDDYGCDVTPQDLLPLLSGAVKLPRLRHLGIVNTTWGDELAPLLVDAKILKHLVSLDLSRSHLTVTGMRVLAASKARFAHLSQLDVSECLLDKEGQRLARSLCRNVEVADQEDPTDHQPDPDDADARWWRYSAVGE